jgi:DUF1680 family protein
MEAKVGPVVDMTRSPHAALRPAPVNAVRLEDGFWSPRLAINREFTLPAQRRQCEETGRVDNFRRAAGRKQGEFAGLFFNDSDVYKWAEAAAWSLTTHPDPKLDADLDAVIAEIAAAQQPDGYLNSYFMFAREKERFTNLKDMHEIYCAGHLIQAAVAHRRATGKTTFLDVACRLADHLCDVFGPGRRVGACGHEEAEMALVELYRETDEKRYLELASCMIEARGRKPPVLGGSPYHQDHLPFTQQKEMIGHAVRQMYLCCGAADVVAETGKEGYRHALDTLWDNFTGKKMYVTGGAGSRYEGEAFGADYELPNDRAYTETCAAIGSVMWNWRMLNLTGEAKYADLMELTLYNAVLPGLSLDGARYFYQNPLADRGGHRRQEWFGCACCPPNIARMLASLPGYFYSVSEGYPFVHLYASGIATLPLPDGGHITLEQKTKYPWEGAVEITVLEQSGTMETITLRVPTWAVGATATWVPDVAEMRADLGVEIPEGYQPDAITIDLEAGEYHPLPMPRPGESILLTLPMNVQRIESHPHVLGNRRHVALQRGPLVYCIEQADHTEDVWDILLPADAELTPEFVPDLLGGVTVLRGQAVAPDAFEGKEALYRPCEPPARLAVHPTPLTAIPYYAWANREAGPMQVWIPTI